MAHLVQLSVSFQYPSTGYVSSTSGGAVNQLVNILQPPPINTPVSITNVATGNPATVYTDSTGGTTIGSLATDSGGNITGLPWIAEGFYAITASPSGSFTGATIYWSAVRGDGVTNIYNEIIQTVGLADGSVTCVKIDPTCRSYMVPTGGVLSFGGSAAPTGYLMCDGSQYSQTGTQAPLYAVIGTTYNTGGETAGYFRVPDLRARFSLGANNTTPAGSRGGSLNHTHTIPGLSVSGHSIGGQGFSATVPGHSHPLSANGGTALTFDFQLESPIFGTMDFYYDYSNAYATYNFLTRCTFTDPLTFNGFTAANLPLGAPISSAGLALIGNTDYNVDTVISGTTSGSTVPAGTTGGGTSGTNNPPYVALNYIIRT